jgi:hypothetical protein
MTSFLRILYFLIFFQLSGNLQSQEMQWAKSTRETKPWSRWWWHGSALTKEGITAEMEAYKKAGLGGLEITPIYGVYGTEKQFVNYLSPEWLDLLKYTFQEAERLDLGIDMATGTGWPFGGPWVSSSDACKNLEHKTFIVKGGERLKEKVIFIQQPFVRAVGNQIYQVQDTAKAAKEPLMQNKDEIKISQLVEPIANNKNLQLLALDQVKFEKALPLETLIAYSGKQVLDLTNKVTSDGTLNWVAPQGNWKLYAVFSGWHGKMVERAGPGGEGNVIDHFSAKALDNYLNYFDVAFKNHNLSSLRSFFNDSYEVDDARGSADWTPLLFEEFEKRRGYDLRQHLPALFGDESEDKNKRILCDYRETISELVLENFTARWRNWAHKHNALVRNQAHGSPANILDLYATVDIPEIEGVEPLRIKMATSAGNVTGKKLISSESATWLNEHFESNLSDIKTAVDRFMIHGVNHILYHGTAYSPPNEPWPGWLFYAAVHLNPRNSLWPHFSTLNKYIERSQSLLQQSRPDNDILLYYPIYDRFSTPGEEMIEHFDGVGVQFENTAFKRGAEKMLTAGYAFDYVSDKQLSKTKVEEEELVTEGGARYKTVVVPQVSFIPITTFQKLLTLAEEGATVIFFEGLPTTISGYSNVAEHQKAFDLLLKSIAHSAKDGAISVGKGRVVIDRDLEKILSDNRIRRETMVQQGIQFLRKKTVNGKTQYFLSNGEKAFKGWVQFHSKLEGALIQEAMNGTMGTGKTRRSKEGFLEVFLQLAPRESVFVTIQDKPLTGTLFRSQSPLGDPPVQLDQWKIEFTAGGPLLPPSSSTATLGSWTTYDNPVYKSFSGCATYTTSFKRPQVSSDIWLLDLGDVKESAEVRLNGKSLGVLLGPSFQTLIENTSLLPENELSISVCNLMANRISDLDRRHIFWKKFYNVNFPARKAENRKNGIFDASEWRPKPSGLLGPVTLQAMQSDTID